jgi:hypothetical protein
VRRPRYNYAEWCWAIEYTTMQQAQLWMFFGGVVAWVVCGCILTRKRGKRPPTLRAAVLDERQPSCFALEEERGGHWSGSGVPVIKEARPTL